MFVRVQKRAYNMQGAYTHACDCEYVCGRLRSHMLARVVAAAQTDTPVFFAHVANEGVVHTERGDPRHLRNRGTAAGGLPLDFVNQLDNVQRPCQISQAPAGHGVAFGKPVHLGLGVRGFGYMHE